MQQVDPDDPRLKQRPIWGLLILLLPMLGVAVVFVLYGAMFFMGMTGRTASGPPAELFFEACPEARAVVAHRLEDMGLHQTATFSETAGGFSLTLTLTGDPEVDARLPEVLAMPGALQVRGGESVLADNADLSGASVRLDLVMVPSVLLDLAPEAAERVKQYVRSDPLGDVTFFVDGQYAGRQANLEPVAIGQLELAPDHLVDERERMVTVAEWSVVVDHPLPCTVTAVRAPVP